MTVSDRLDFLVESWRPWVLLVLLSLALFTPGIATIPPVDRDEARYIQATRQMLETHDFVQIRFQDEARNKKPVGVYWLQAALVSVFGGPEATAVWPYRLASTLGAIAAVLLTFRLGAAILDRRSALIGAGLLACSLLLVTEAHLATTDAVLLATAVAGQGALAAIYVMARRGEPTGFGLAAAFWIAEAAAILVKGPVVPMVAVTTILALVIADRQVAWLTRLRPVLGIPLLLVLVLPWFVAVQKATNGSFLSDAIGNDLLPKLLQGQEAHGAWPGYYLTLVIASFWPGSLFLAAGISWAWRHRRIPAARVLAAWVVPAWLIFELVPTKLPHYVLPLYPALALVCGRALVSVAEDALPAVRAWISWSLFGLWALVGIAVGVLAVALPFELEGLIGPAGAIALAGSFATVLHMARGPRRHGPGSAVVVVCGALVVIMPIFAVVLPRLEPAWLSRRAAAAVADVGHLATRPVVSVGYAEPSLVFLLGTGTRLLTPPAAAAALAHHDATLALVADRENAAFRADLSALHLVPHAVSVVSGFDYSNGRWLTLTLYSLPQD
ncbi:MAG TPA: glycosyltransferase family 39 protein [Stellaceae bacterium]|nr:glycosyltransferase family 39 protein [Stellaceae bacterium]